MRVLWQLIRVAAELVLFLAMTLAALTLIDAYMVVFAGLRPGDLMFMHEAQPLSSLLFELSVILVIGGAAFAVRYKALRNLAC